MKHARDQVPREANAIRRMDTKYVTNRRPPPDPNSTWRTFHLEKMVKACVVRPTAAVERSTVFVTDRAGSPRLTGVFGLRDAFKSPGYAAVQADERHFVETHRLAAMVVREVEVVREGKLVVA